MERHALFSFCTRKPACQRVSGDKFNVKSILSINRAHGEKSSRPQREITFISYLLLAIQARDARIARLEQFDFQKAVALMICAAARKGV